MSTWKAARRNAAQKPSAPYVTAAVSKRPPAPLVDIVSLEIEDDENPGGDPYNHTGQFCVPGFDECLD